MTGDEAKDLNGALLGGTSADKGTQFVSLGGGAEIAARAPATTADVCTGVGGPSQRTGIPGRIAPPACVRLLPPRMGRPAEVKAARAEGGHLRAIRGRY